MLGPIVLNMKWSANRAVDDFARNAILSHFLNPYSACPLLPPSQIIDTARWYFGLHAADDLEITVH